MTDQEIIIRALHDAREILGAYIEPRPRSCEDTMNALLRVLDQDSVVAALHRLDKRRAFTLVEIEEEPGRH
jgi:hypothetical protein